MDEFETVEANLAHVLGDLIYIPIKKFIAEVNKSGKTYDLGIRISKFKETIHNEMENLKKTLKDKLDKWDTMFE